MIPHFKVFQVISPKNTDIFLARNYFLSQENKHLFFIINVLSTFKFSQSFSRYIL